MLNTPLLVCRPATSRMLGYLPCPILQLQAKSSVMWLESPRRGRNWSCLLRTHHTGAGPKWPQVPSGITMPLVRLLNQLHRPPGRTRNSGSSRAAAPGNPSASRELRPWVSPTFSQPLGKHQASSSFHSSCLSGCIRPSSLFLTAAVQQEFPSSTVQMPTRPQGLVYY